MKHLENISTNNLMSMQSYNEFVISVERIELKIENACEREWKSSKLIGIKKVESKLIRAHCAGYFFHKQEYFKGEKTILSHTVYVNK